MPSIDVMSDDEVTHVVYSVCLSGQSVLAKTSKSKRSVV